MAALDSASPGSPPIGGQTAPRTSAIGAFWNTAKMSVGLGMLALPYAFSEAGCGLATATFVVLSFLAADSCRGIVQVSKTLRDSQLSTAEASGNCQKKMSYADVVERVLGRRWRGVCLACLWLSMAGGATGYEIFICNTFAAHLGVFSYQGWLWLLQVPILAVCLARSMRIIALFSMAGLFCLWSGFGSAIALATDEARHHGWQNPPFATGLRGYLLYLGIVTFGFEALAAIILNVEQSMAKPQYFDRVLQGAISSVVVVDVGFALICCLAFGTVEQVITNNFAGALGTTASLLFSFELFFSFPGVMYPLWRPLEASAVGVLGRGAPLTRGKHVLVCSATRTLVMLLLAVIAAFFGDQFAKFTSVIGGFACAGALFLIPAIMRLKLAPRHFSMEKCLAGASLVVGIIAPIASLYTIIDP